MKPPSSGTVATSPSGEVVLVPAEAFHETDADTMNAVKRTCPFCRAEVLATAPGPDGRITCSACGGRFDPYGSETSVTDPDVDAAKVLTWVPAKGDTFGPYALMSPLGRGGMSTVFLAHHGELKRPVAIKILHPHVAEDEGLRQRFRREATALAGLDHPNILPVHDFGEHRGRPYLVMMAADGGSLREEFERSAGKKLPLLRVAAIARQALAGLKHAHANGIVHRDIKPENLLIDGEGALRLADFGIARLVAGPEQETLTKLTMTGMVMGTAAYMAPEQSSSPTDVDGRADLFALGVVCYEALTGHLPQGRFEDPVSRDMVSSRDSLKKWNAFWLTLLERNPSARPGDAAQALAALEASLVASTGPTAVSEDAAEPPPEGEGLAGRARAAMDLPDEVQAAMGAAPAAEPDDYPHGYRLMRPRRGQVLGGVCAGLGTWSGVHPFWLRVALIVGIFTIPPVVIVGYVVSLFVIPVCGEKEYRPYPLNSWLPRRKSGWFFGVCALLGERSSLSPWLWRIALLIPPFWFVSIPIYLAMAIILPGPKFITIIKQGAVERRPAPESSDKAQIIVKHPRNWVGVRSALATAEVTFVMSALTLLLWHQSEIGRLHGGTTVILPIITAGALFVALGLLFGRGVDDGSNGGTGGGLIRGAAITMLMLPLFPFVREVPLYSANMFQGLVCLSFLIFAAGALLGLMRRRPMVALSSLVFVAIPFLGTLVFARFTDPLFMALSPLDRSLGFGQPLATVGLLIIAWLVVLRVVKWVGNASLAPVEGVVSRSQMGAAWILTTGALLAGLIILLSLDPEPLKSLYSMVSLAIGTL